MNYPDYNTYSKLYGRYLQKSIQPFFEGVDLVGKRVLDLCTGGGQLAQYAIDANAKEVVMVDAAPQMLNPAFDGKGRAVQIESDVVDYLGNFRNGTQYIVPAFSQGMKTYYGGAADETQFDVITARQCINYWFDWVSGEEIAKVVKKGGLFVFNTFGNKPSEKPTVREYFHGGIGYAEVSYLIGDTVYHVQTAAGMPPHFTEFKWIPPETYKQKLSPYFIIREVVDGPSSMWYCWKV